MLNTVPTLSIVFMGISAAVAILLPIILVIIAKKKTDGKLINVLIGAVTFVIFALVLESLVHQIVLRLAGIDPNAGQAAALRDHLAFMAIYGGLAAGLFEETGRFLAMKFVMKKPLRKENALMYGLGHGGIEAIILCGITYISNIALSLLINSGATEKIFKDVPDGLMDQAMAQIEPLWTTASPEFLLAGLERISAILIHICLSYLVYRAVKDQKIQLFIAAILAHAVFDGVFVVATQFIPLLAVELIMLAIVLVAAFFTLKAYRAEKPAEITE